LFAHAWPDNIRGLDKALNRALLLSAGLQIEQAHLFASTNEESEPVREWESQPAQSRKAELERLLTVHAGNVTAVSAALHTSRPQVYRLCHRFALDPELYRKPT